MRRRLWSAAVGVLTVSALACGGGDDAGDMDTPDTTSAAQPPAATTPPAGTPPAGTAQLPEGVTQEMVTAGQQVFQGAGICITCHGPDATGTPLAPNLTDQTWINIDGSYDAIVQLVTNGVPQPVEHPSPMPPKGGSQITDQQIREVAAYVYTLSHGG
jgi:mono/diheme cytochrome c family protein